VGTKQRLVKRFEIVVYKDKTPGSDNAQVPALATINIYKQGSTVKTATSVPLTVDPVPVPVYDLGRIVVGDSLVVGVSSNTLLVDSITLPDTLNLLNTSGSTINLAVGARLVPTTAASRPNVYSDPLGSIALGSSIASDSVSGRANGYIRDRNFDYIVSGAGITPRLFIDASGGFELTAVAWISVLDYPTLQAAVDAVPADGAVVYIPQGPQGLPYSSTSLPAYNPPLILPFDRAVRLLGDGSFRTYLQSTDASKDMIQMGGDYSAVEGMTLLGPNQGGAGRGIVIWRKGDYQIPYQADIARNIVYRAAVRDCRIQWMPSWGIYVDDATRNGLPEFAVWALFDGVEIRENKLNPSEPDPTKKGGCVYLGLNGTTTQFFRGCNFKNFLGFGVRVRQAQGVSLSDCILENGDDSQPYVSLENCELAALCHCWFEGKTFNASGIPTMPYVESSGSLLKNLLIDSCLFTRTGSAASTINPRAIKIGTLARGVSIRNVQITVGGGKPASGNNHIEIEADAEAIVQGGTLSDNGPTRAPRILDTTGASGEKRVLLLGALPGLRIPRITLTQRAAVPDWVNGDLVWIVDPNTSGQNLQIMIGGVWRAVQWVTAT